MSATTFPFLEPVSFSFSTWFMFLLFFSRGVELVIIFLFLVFVHFPFSILFRVFIFDW